MRFAEELALTFCLALGMTLGGTLVGSLAGLLHAGFPPGTIASLAQRIKLWAVLAALGGALQTFRNLETGLLGGRPEAFLRQAALLIAAMLGSQLGYLLLASLDGPP